MIDATEQSRRTRAGYPIVRALCCDCGTVRTTSTYGSHGEPDAADLDLCARHGYELTRCTVWRKCATCGQTTRHAWLRDDLAPAERASMDTPLSERLSPIVTELIDMLEGCGVRVWWEDTWSQPHRQVALLTQWLDDNTWHVALNRDADVEQLARGLEFAWSVLTTAGDDLGDVWRSTAGTPDDPDDPPRRYSFVSVPRPLR